MEIIDLTKQLPFVKSVGKRSLASIQYGILHHDTVLAQDSYNALTRYKVEAIYHVKKGWGHLGYHLKVARNGEVYQTLPFEEVAYHAGSWLHNLRGIGICFDGSFDKQKVSFQQKEALIDLLDYLSLQRPDMPKLVKTSFFGHTQVRLAPTFCPSPEILSLLKSYKK